MVISLPKILYTNRIYKVGQNRMYTVYIRDFWQGNNQIYGHIRCIYSVLANPTYLVFYFTRSWCYLLLCTTIARNTQVQPHLVFHATISIYFILG